MAEKIRYAPLGSSSTANMSVQLFDEEDLRQKNNAHDATIWVIFFGNNPTLTKRIGDRPIEKGMEIKLSQYNSVLSGCYYFHLVLCFQ